MVTFTHRFVPKARSLLMSASLGKLKDVGTLIEKLLACIEPVDVPHNEIWGGKAFQLSRRNSGSRQLSVALLHILSHRWLPTMRYASLALFARYKLIHRSGAATAGNLQRFVHLLFSQIYWRHAAKDNPTRETEQSMAITPLRSPAFWELPELRCMWFLRFRDLIPYTDFTAALLAYLSGMTSHLDVTDVVKTLENLPPSSDFSPDIRQVQAVYTLLRYTPMEYLPKSVRIELTKKAIVFDGQLVSALKSGSASDLASVLSLSREYMSRSIAHATVFDRQVLCHLIPSKPS